MAAESSRIPVILDTDIGGDIDDTWALAMMLKSPELDVKLVVSDTGDTDYRARIIAKMLDVAERMDVPVGVGRRFGMKDGYNQAGWVEGYTLSAYQGTVREDGVGAIIDTIMNSSTPVTLICIGPVPNIAEALRREPSIVENARFVGMHGSVRKGYGGSSRICAEYNVVNHIPECQRVFSVAWDMTITPLDTCGLVVLEGENYRSVRLCDDPLVRALMENYGVWLSASQRPPDDFDRKSSVLFDTVAVYLAFAEELLVMENLGIRVSDEGYTLIDENAKRIRVATDWKDIDSYRKFLVKRLTSKRV